MRDMKLFPVAMILHNLYLSKLRNVPVFLFKTLKQVIYQKLENHHSNNFT